MGHRPSLPRVFIQAFQDEVLALTADRNPFGEADVLIDYLEKVILAPDIEGNFAIEELVDQDANVPDVYLVVVVLFQNYFWRRVERSPASGAPQKRRVDRPSEIANFNDSLHDWTNTS